MTTVRLLLFIPYYFLFSAGDYFLAGTAYLVALVTDLDGAVARKLHATSFFGSIYDPTVDILFMLGGFALLIAADKIVFFPVAVYLFAVVFKFIPQLLHLVNKKRVKSTIPSKILGFVGYATVLLATFGLGKIFITVILLLGAAGHIVLGTYWLKR